jgi:hypothetical protein
LLPVAGLEDFTENDINAKALIEFKSGNFSEVSSDDFAFLELL